MRKKVLCLVALLSVVSTLENTRYRCAEISTYFGGGWVGLECCLCNRGVDRGVLRSCIASPFYTRELLSKIMAAISVLQR